MRGVFLTLLSFKEIKNDASLFAYTLQLGSLAGGQERTDDR